MHSIFHSMIRFPIPIETAEDIDDSVFDWIKEAYEQAG